MGRELTCEEVDYVVNLLMAWINNETNEGETNE